MIVFEMEGEEGEFFELIVFDGMDIEGNCLLVYYFCDFDG